MDIDEIDKKLLKELQKNCRQSVYDLAKKLKLSKSAIHHRIKKYEKNGIIKRYSALLDYTKLGYPALAFMKFGVKQFSSDQKGRFPIIYIADALAKFDRVQECYSTAGQEDIIIKVYGKDLEDIHEWQRNTINKIPRMDKVCKSIETIFIVHRSKEMPTVEFT